ncbi:MAG TPA: flagellar export protein FliJ [Hyphomicrobium sp.]
MRKQKSALRLKRFEADEKARKVADLEHMIREFENKAADLDRQIRAEEDRTRIKDPGHFAYSTFAKSASLRRDNLRTSADGLKAKLEATSRERDEALERFNCPDTAATQEELRNCRRAEQVAAALRDINRQRQNPHWMCRQDQPALETEPRRIASSGTFS